MVKRTLAPKFEMNTYNGALKLSCPRCHEVLTQADIEAFSQCPFCNCNIEQSDKLEDFIFQELINNWIAKGSQY